MGPALKILPLRLKAYQIPSNILKNEVDALDEVIAGHGDFCALLASRSTAAAFLKAGCTHAKTVNRPTFRLTPSDLIDIPSES